MAKKLTKLRVDSVDVVDRGAGEGVRIALIKGAGGEDQRRWAGNWDSAFGLLPKKRRQATTKQVDDDGESDSVARARAEIASLRTAEPRSVETAKHQVEDDTMPEVDITKRVTARITEMRKADPTLRSDASAMAKLAEARDADSQELWRNFKENTAPASSPIEKTVNVAKALKRMSKRRDELMAADATIRSRESAIAKVAASPDPADRQLWERYKAANAPAGSGEHNVRPRYDSPSEMALAELVRALRAAHPTVRMSESAWRKQALRVQRHAPASVQALTNYRL